MKKAEPRQRKRSKGKKGFSIWWDEDEGKRKRRRRRKNIIRIDLQRWGGGAEERRKGEKMCTCGLALLKTQWKRRMAMQIEEMKRKERKIRIDTLLDIDWSFGIRYVVSTVDCKLWSWLLDSTHEDKPSHNIMVAYISTAILYYMCNCTPVYGLCMCVWSLDRIFINTLRISPCNPLYPFGIRTRTYNVCMS